MNRNVLIEAVVGQATVLIAHLATQGGARAPLSEVADQVFASLVAALDEQAIGQKVIADMFGMALRTYYERVRRLSESRTLRGRSLWEAVLTHVRTHGPIARDALMRRFQADDEQVLRAILRDLADHALVQVAGRGGSATYRAAGGGSGEPERDALIQVAVFHAGQTTVPALAEGLRLDVAAVEASIARLVADGRVARAPGGLVRADVCVIPAGDEAGWEGAVFDHVQALVGALCHKLRRAGRPAEPIDQLIGGSTYTFDLSPDNPTSPRVHALLTRMRKELSDLRAEADAFEATQVIGPLAPRERTRVIFYFGGNVLAEHLPEAPASPSPSTRKRPRRTR
ncbi:MAG: hypothetical protein IT385_04350 [Deltaproteobacteria bacterium]|nr:hypothetical protein [Deltaproteobacteria bacterium]